MNFVRLPGFATQRDAERWCEDLGLLILHTEVGPDGMVRGLATGDVDAVAGDLELRAMELEERAIAWAGALR